MPGDIQDEQKHAPSKVWGRLWVGGTTTLIGFLEISAHFGVLLPAFDWKPFHKDIWRQLLLLNFFVVMIFWTYYRTVTFSPGHVPAGWSPPMEDESSTADSAKGAVEVKPLTGRPRYCRSCQAYKPPRSHHCRQCRRCILRMDHHCPWTNNCIGYFNYPDFLRFLFYVDCACGYHLYLITKVAFGDTFHMRDPTASWIVWLVINYTLSTPILIAVGCFSIYHLYLLMTNTTTIESSEKERSATMRRRGHIRYMRFPYNLGWRQNMCAVLGQDVVWWWWPQRPEGNGLSYPVSDEVAPEAQYAWPPQPPPAPRYNSYVPVLGSDDEDGPAKPPLNPEDAFTYGNERLNPSLQATRGAQCLNPSYDSDPEDDDDDDDAPLGHLAPGYGGRSKVRRGSEGYEVRPMTTAQRLREIGMDMPPVESFEQRVRGIDSESEQGNYTSSEYSHSDYELEREGAERESDDERPGGRQ